VEGKGEGVEAATGIAAEGEGKKSLSTLGGRSEGTKWGGGKEALAGPKDARGVEVR